MLECFSLLYNKDNCIHKHMHILMLQRLLWGTHESNSQFLNRNLFFVGMAPKKRPAGRPPAPQRIPPHKEGEYPLHGGDGSIVGVWRRVPFSITRRHRGEEKEFWSDWSPFQWFPVPGTFRPVRTGMSCDGRGYLKMPRRLGEKYFHRQLLEDSGVAYAGHEMVAHHDDGNICNNSEENLLFMSRPDHAREHWFGGAH